MWHESHIYYSPGNDFDLFSNTTNFATFKSWYLIMTSPYVWLEMHNTMIHLKRQNHKIYFFSLARQKLLFFWGPVL
jgi:hypothetical protein